MKKKETVVEKETKKEKTSNNETKIIETINQLRPYLNSDGGDIEYIKYEDNYVFVKLYGACAACMYKDYTIQDNIYEAIKEIVPECKGIINVEL
ncbi:MAG: NifU family protein [Erysipelotrichales bacterium]|nr:NifU family protein [Erysipelotrichales bacterium]